MWRRCRGCCAAGGTGDAQGLLPCCGGVRPSSTMEKRDLREEEATELVVDGCAGCWWGCCALVKAEEGTRGRWGGGVAELGFCWL